jgi:hypothetical protein
MFIDFQRIGPGALAEFVVAKVLTLKTGLSRIIHDLKGELTSINTDQK